MQWVNGIFNGNDAKIFFEMYDNRVSFVSKVRIGGTEFRWDEFSPLEQEKLLKEIDRNNGDVI